GGASNLSTVPETGIGWAQFGTELRAIEPLGGTVIGRTAFDKAPSALSADPVRHRLVGVATDRLECAGGRPQFAWRLFSAIFGGAGVGSKWVGPYALVAIGFLILWDGGARG